MKQRFEIYQKQTMTNDGFSHDCCCVLMDYNEAKNAIMFGFVTKKSKNMFGFVTNILKNMFGFVTN
jgi:hypothetical protein